MVVLVAPCVGVSGTAVVGSSDVTEPGSKVGTSFGLVEAGAAVGEEGVGGRLATVGTVVKMSASVGGEVLLSAVGSLVIWITSAFGAGPSVREASGAAVIAEAAGNGVTGGVVNTKLGGLLGEPAGEAG